MDRTLDTALDLVYEALDLLSEHSDFVIEKHPEIDLVSHLDSLGYANLLAALEELSDRRFGRSVTLYTHLEGEASAHSITIRELADKVVRAWKSAPKQAPHDV